MNRSNDDCASVAALEGQLQRALGEHPRSGSRQAVTRAPGVIDVMGDICEGGGSLLLTATLGLSVTVAGWATRDDRLRLRLHVEGSQQDFAVPAGLINESNSNGADLLRHCRDASAEWAAPACLALGRSIAEGVLPSLKSGLFLLMNSSFPEECDFGRPCAAAAAVLDVTSKVVDVEPDRFKKAAIAAEAVAPLTGISRPRLALTSVCGPADGSLVQIRQIPSVECVPLALPSGVTVIGIRTTLTRPTSPQRLAETQLCAEMGARMIHELRRQDGKSTDGRPLRLAAVTPSDFVDRFRDRMSSKITASQFVARFGKLRGLDDAHRGRDVFKVRSRAEHYIYEHKRVLDFAAHIMRAARSNGSEEHLIDAGELMYASHWSHSQRCGIGGVEADHVVKCLRRQGPAGGIYGAKVTGGGAGGELVVLMRDDEKGRAALAAAIAEARQLCVRPVDTFSGSLPGIEFYEPPASFARLLGSPATV